MAGALNMKTEWYSWCIIAFYWITAAFIENPYAQEAVYASCITKLTQGIV